ncbi:hypothetical protein KFL01_03360 [Kocuria flava]|uniref:Uncharacterized protein n=1 Tax=Kocuria flava TaxID=446860 RepID=A0ABQ0X8H6_9MICC|nr:hypothetical protein KFL01_03360 [Kocuria flava]
MAESAAAGAVVPTARVAASAPATRAERRAREGRAEDSSVMGTSGGKEGRGDVRRTARPATRPLYCISKLRRRM